MAHRSIQLVALFAALGCLVAAGVVAPWVTQQRRELNLVYDVGQEEAGSFDSLIGQAALGSFRGVFVNVLWYHAEHQKRAGRLFDANDTAQLITKLQPRFPQVWSFNAWNMAYNISVITHTPAERWNWVSKGIDLLRDRGIPANPTAVRLYRELGWIFFHKVGRWSDDMHWYYKQQLAAEWMSLLSVPPTGRRGDEATAAFAPIAEAAERYFLFDRPPRETRDRLDTLAQGLEADDPLLAERLLELKWADTESLEQGLDRLIERYADRRPRLAEALEPLYEQARARLADALLVPMNRLRRDAPSVSPLLARLDELGYRIGQDLASDREAVLDFGRLRYQMSVVPASQFPDELRPLAQLRADAEHAEAWATLLAFLRAKVLTRHYHMDPAFMHDLMETYGPLDWRHPAAHCVYWSAMGIERSELLRSAEDVDFINTQRQVVHGLQALMHEGRLAFDPITGSIDLLPDARFISAYEKAVFGKGQEISALYRDLDARESHFAQGHKNFLADATVFAFVYGDEAQAREYFTRLRDLYGEDQPDRFMNKTLEQFVFSDFFAEGVPSRAGATAFVEGRLNQAFAQGLAYGRLDTFERQMNLARRAHREFQTARDYTTPNAPRQRLQLSPFPQMVEKAFASYLMSPRVDILLRARAYQRAPMELRAAVYGQIQEPLERQTQQRGLAMQRAFPVPEGYTPPQIEGDEQAASDAPETVERQ